MKRALWKWKRKQADHLLVVVCALVVLTRQGTP